MTQKRFLSLGLAALTLGSLAACTHHDASKAIARKTASTIEPPLEAGEVWDQSNDDETDKVIAINEQMLLERAKGESYLYRDAHPKTHGCAKAEFEVDSSALPADLRVGVFAPTLGSKFSAWVRFSNGNPDGVHAPDSDKDIRGMAIKLINVPEATSGSQDFVMLTSKEFFSEGADDYIALHDALSDGKIATLFYLGTHWKQAGILLSAEIKPANSLDVQYYSSVPYKLGDRTMKFTARPCANNGIADVGPEGVAPSPNFLRERLVSTLKAKTACFDFFVQPNMDPEKNPVENSTITWSDKTSPYIKVATLRIPQQTGIDSEGQLNFCENLSFDPWHSRVETRPMGQINRMRKKIYPAISDLRHRTNHIPILEPKSLEACEGETAALCQSPRR